jgi:hypothetical protein
MITHNYIIIIIIMSNYPSQRMQSVSTMNTNNLMLITEITVVYPGNRTEYSLREGQVIHALDTLL